MFYLADDHKDHYPSKNFGEPGKYRYGPIIT